MTIEEEIIKDLKDLKELQSSNEDKSNGVEQTPDKEVPAAPEGDKNRSKESYEERTHDTWEKNPRNNETKTQYEEAEIIVEESE